MHLRLQASAIIPVNMKDTKKALKRFQLTEDIKTRKALVFAQRYTPLPFKQRMKLAKAQKAITLSFN